MIKGSNIQNNSELYNQSKNKEDFITLNIYNLPKGINENSIYDNNQTEANLIIGNNNALNKKDDCIDDLRKKAKYLDNTRENPTPLSENRGVNQLTPQILNINKNNYSKSLNPSFQDKNKEYLNDVPISTQKELKEENNNIQTIKYSNDYRNQISKKNMEDKKMKKSIPCGHICCVFYYLCTPFAICLLLFQCCSKKENNNKNENE